MRSYTLDNAMSKGRSYNLNFLRFIAALVVIISHAYPLSLGIDHSDFMTSFSNNKLGLGGIAVGVFFFSSGLLVSKSVENKNTIKKYFEARCLRIFPPLILIVLLSIFLLGPIFTNLSLYEYFVNPNTYLYIRNAILLPFHNLPGVFDGNIYGSVVNGALWTLPVEFLCYIGLFICYKLNLMNKKIMKYTIPLFVIVMILCFYSEFLIFITIRQFVQPVFIFYVGMLCYVYRDKITLNKVVALMFCGLWIVLVYLNLSEIAMIVIFPYIILTFIYSDKQCSKSLSRLGDYSYGIYLCGFPVQQIIVNLNNGHMSAVLNYLIAIPIACVIGIVIYNIAEKPFLQYNKNSENTKIECNH